VTPLTSMGNSAQSINMNDSWSNWRGSNLCAGGTDY